MGYHQNKSYYVLAARPCEASGAIAFEVRRGAAVFADATAEEALVLVQRLSDGATEVADVVGVGGIERRTTRLVIEMPVGRK